jgi:GT2 family glycosyltransferase
MGDSHVWAIVVVYNGMRWLDRCLGSLTRSTPNVNIVAVDNGSTDGSQNFIRNRYPNVDLRLNGSNLGFGKANNIGIRLAYDEGADYVLLLNQDAWLEQECIASLVKGHKSLEEYGIVSPLQLNGSGTALDYNFSLCIGPNRCAGLYSDKWLNSVRDCIYEVKSVPAAAWLVSRACLENVGGFSPAFFHYGEDDNYIQRACYHGYKTGVYPFARAYHDREQRTQSSYFDQDVAEYRDLLIRMNNPLENYEVSQLIRKYRRTLLQYLIYGKLSDFCKCLYERKRTKKAWLTSLHLREQTKKPGLHFF